MFVNKPNLVIAAELNFPNKQGVGRVGKEPDLVLKIRAV
jgi:hypothetical protein